MKIRKLQLENFRNYSNYSYDFDNDKEITILLGPNGQGKTNFLEALYTLSLGKSFRTSTQEDLIEWGNEYSRCNCEITTDNDTINLEVFYSKALNIRDVFVPPKPKELLNTYLGSISFGM